MFKLRHAHFPAAEFHALHLQAKALVETVFSGKGDPSACGHHAMPGQSVGLIQHAYYHAGATGNTGGRSDGSVARDPAARDFHDRLPDAEKTRIGQLGFGHRLIVTTKCNVQHRLVTCIRLRR